MDWAAAVSGVADLGTGVLDLIGAGTYTQQERAEHDVARDYFDVLRGGQAADVRVAELAFQTAAVGGSQETRKTGTLVLGGVLAALIVAGAVVVTRG